MSFKRSVLFFITVLFLSNTYARPHFFPRGCHERGYRFEDSGLVLRQSHKKNQALFFIYNNSKDDIKMMIADKDLKPYYPNYKKTLHFQYWSAFAMQDSSLNFTCYRTSTKKIKGHPVNCKHVLRLCQFTKAAFDGSNRGTYWVKVNAKLHEVIKEAVNKGVYLRR